MRKIALFAALAIMGFGASEGRIAHLIRTSFPSDLAQREALHRCSIADSQFSRFSESDRAACYQQNNVVVLERVHGLPAPPEFASRVR